MPIVGVSPNHPGWQKILNEFQSHMNPTVTKKLLQELFRNPAHCGYLASLLLMKQILLSPDSYWRTLVDVKRTIVSLMTSLAKLLDLGMKNLNPRAIFARSKSQFTEELLTNCGCGDCLAITGQLEAFVEGSRLPKLSPHVKQCEIEKLLISIHHSALLMTKLSINEEHLAALLMDPLNYLDFENKAKMAILASILHIGSLYFLVDGLERGLFAEVEQEIVDIVSMEDSTPFPCSSKRALDLVLSQSDGACHRVTLPYLPTKQHLPPSDGAKLSKSLVEKLSNVLKMGSPLSISSSPPIIDPKSVSGVVEEPIVKEVSIPCHRILSDLGKRHQNLRNGEYSLRGGGKQHLKSSLSSSSEVTPYEDDDPIDALNLQLSNLKFVLGDADSSRQEVPTLFSVFEGEDFKPLDLLNGDERWEEVIETEPKDGGSWIINRRLSTDRTIDRPPRLRKGTDPGRKKKKKPTSVSNPYFRVNV